MSVSNKTNGKYCCHCGRATHPSNKCHKIVPCRHCGKTGHPSAGCYKAQTCGLCKVTGHPTFKCTAPSCTSCKTIGKTYDDCCGKKFCYLCNVKGHGSIDCQKRIDLTCGCCSTSAQIHIRYAPTQVQNYICDVCSGLSKIYSTSADLNQCDGDSQYGLFIDTDSFVLKVSYTVNDVNKVAYLPIPRTFGSSDFDCGGNLVNHDIYKIYNHTSGAFNRKVHKIKLIKDIRGDVFDPQDKISDLALLLVDPLRDHFLPKNDND